MEKIQDIYKEYIGFTSSLPNEMIKRGIQSTDCFINGEFYKVNVDGKARVNVRNQPLLSRIGFTNYATKDIDLKCVGEILYHLAQKDHYQSAPKSLDEIVPDDLEILTKSLRITEMLVKGASIQIE